MLEITLQFKSVDEAIVALGKLTGGKVAAAVAAPAAEKATIVAEKATGAQVKTGADGGETQAKTGKRKPRADAGKPRGPNARTAGDAQAQPATNAAAQEQEKGDVGAEKSGDQANPSATATPSAGIPDAAAAEPPPQTDAEAALTAVFEQKGLVVAQEVLARFGLKRLKDILPDQRAAFIAAAKAVLEGGVA